MLQLLYDQVDVDFSQYKLSTIRRRIARRMVLRKAATLDKYADSLAGNGAELRRLYEDMLISVTSFFRNSSVFDKLIEDVFPSIIGERAGDEVRVWVPGCAAGQEAYSIIMAFMEFAERATCRARLQVFSTDLNEAALEQGRSGFYPKSALRQVSAERLKRFFVEEPTGYRVSRTLRDAVVFARHNVLKDPPFSRIDLVSCRNLMIYLEPPLQKKLLLAFHYALKQNGFLILGAAESTGSMSDRFTPRDKKLRIYLKRQTIVPSFPIPASQHTPTRKRSTSAPKPDAKVLTRVAGLSPEREADRLTIERFSPPGVLVNADLQIQQFRGDVDRYLRLPPNKADFYLPTMAQESLVVPLYAALEKAKKDQRVARIEAVPVEGEGSSGPTVTIEVIPLKHLEMPHYLVLFTSPAPDPEEATTTSRPPAGTRPAVVPDARRLAMLEHKLAEARDYIRALEEHDRMASEQAQATNEEAQSANEELQSINEELETSKEELESTNEELVTVNEEMISRNAELSRLNSDFTNLHLGLNMPIMVLGDRLVLRYATPSAQHLFNLVEGDIGRTLGGIKHNLDFPDLETFVTETIDSGNMREREVQDKDGHWYMLRVRPYLTPDKVVQGAVLVLLDIDALKRHSDKIKRAYDYAESILRATHIPLLVLRADLSVNTGNEAFYRTFGLTRESTEGRPIFEICGGAWNVPKLRGLLEEVLPRNSFFDDFEASCEIPVLGRRTMLLSAQPLDYDDGMPQLILLSIEDATARMESINTLQASERRFRRLFDTAEEGILLIDPISRKVIDANPWVTTLLGCAHEELVGRELWELGLLKDARSSHATFRDLQEKNSIRFKVVVETPAQLARDIEVLAHIYLEHGREVIQCNLRDASNC